ncbi:uncharacterized protein RSE6_13989 [Rhynchosporium secalis]|uniref:Uncharacterized protein n=1 Tax=Rhynchosporium secalis TaxID=38038 RepID=A0A1E1MU87_RHYSE|nr:uncharacterized protein RSE6_13989 [Rhynchosporium secalis]
MSIFTRSRPCSSPIQPRYRSNTSTYSISPFPSPSPSPPPTIHNRRTLSSRKNSARSSSRSSPPPPSLPDLGLPVSPFSSSKITAYHSNFESQGHGVIAPALRERESDAECWERMLMLQREYHCYNSARLEAAVEALEQGWRIEDVPIPSRFCLDLLNEGLETQIRMTNLH